MNRNEKLLSAVGGIGDDLVLEPAEPAIRSGRRRRLAAAACLALAAAFGALFVLSGIRLGRMPAFCVVNGSIYQRNTGFAAILLNMLPIPISGNAGAEDAPDADPAASDADEAGRTGKLLTFDTSGGLKLEPSQSYTFTTVGSEIIVSSETCRNGLYVITTLGEVTAKTAVFGSEAEIAAGGRTVLVGAEAKAALDCFLKAVSCGSVADVLGAIRGNAALAGKTGDCFALELINDRRESVTVFWWPEDGIVTVFGDFAFRVSDGGALDALRASLEAVGSGE